jgi:hypothetical protein
MVIQNWDMFVETPCTKHGNRTKHKCNVHSLDIVCGIFEHVQNVSPYKTDMTIRVPYSQDKKRTTNVHERRRTDIIFFFMYVCRPFVLYGVE